MKSDYGSVLANTLVERGFTSRAISPFINEDKLRPGARLRPGRVLRLLLEHPESSNLKSVYTFVRQPDSIDPSTGEVSTHRTVSMRQEAVLRNRWRHIGLPQLLTPEAVSLVLVEEVAQWVSEAMPVEDQLLLEEAMKLSD